MKWGMNPFTGGAVEWRPWCSPGHPVMVISKETDGLQITVDVYSISGLPSFSTGLLLQSCIYCKLVSDFPSIRSTHDWSLHTFPTTKRRFIITSWLPAPRPCRAFSYIIHYKRRHRCPQCWLVYAVRTVRWGKTGHFYPMLVALNLTSTCFFGKSSGVATEEDRIQSWKHRRYRYMTPRGYHASTVWLH